MICGICGYEIGAYGHYTQCSPGGVITFAPGEVTLDLSTGVFTREK